MKKRLLALIMTILTIVSGLPTTVLAAGETYRTGDTFTSDTNPPTGGLPGDIPTGTEWSGPMMGYDCGKEEHTHSVNAGCLAYVIDPNRCEGGGDTDWSHWWHSTDCYAIDTSACPGGGTTGNNHRRHTNACYQVEATGDCTLEEHTHSASACGTNYVWTLTETTNTDQHREWWPVYWDFDSQRNNPNAVWDESVVTVTAGGQSIAFSDGEVLSSTALSQAASGTTATIGDVLRGIQITVAPGYFLTEYRLVCGNHTGCGIVTTTTSTGHNADDYTATVDFSPSAGSLDHWYNIGGMHNDEDENDGVYQPTVAPDPNANDIYHTSGSNTIYPFYLLLKVEKDNEAYSISYDWGDLQGQLSASVPAGEDNMLRNSSHTVKAPGNGATEAAALGHVFTGWKVEATGYDTDAIVQPDHTVTVYGGDIKLVAQWATAVSYVYTTPVPDGAPATPASKHYDFHTTVTVEDEPTLTGYTFSGWTTDDATVSGGTFTMPANSVVFEGTFTKDDSQTKALYYQVEYYLNGQLQASETVSKTVSVWVNDPNTVTFDKALNKTFTDYTLHYSAPADLAHYLIEPEHANDDYVFEASEDPNNPTVLKLYYTGTNADLSIEKAVMDQSGNILTHTDVVEASQVLTYVITVTNKGNAPMTGVKITDTHNGDGLITFTDTTEIVYANGVFTIRELSVDDPDTANVNEGQVTITYTYTVAQADAGKTLVNYATWRSDDGSKESTDDAEVKVEEWYTLTIEYYADGVLQSGRTETEDMAAGDNYFVNVPTDITVNSDVYAFDAPATTDPLSGTLTADTTVKLYYAKDELGDGDQPDGTPDKYQAVFEYVATTGGTITGITTEVVNVYDAAKFVDADRDVSLLTAEDMAVKGVAVASGSKAENTNASVYEFSHWTLARKGHATFEIGVTTETLGSYQLPPVQGESLEAHWTVAGATYVFTAVYNEIPKPALLLDKLVARHENLPVGTKVEYVIHVHNAGNVDLTNIVVTDDLFYKNGEELTLIPNYMANVDNVRISGTTADNYEVGTAYSYIKIRTLRAGDTISIEYEYVIQPADAGKTIHNIAEATTTYNNETLFEEDSATITVAQKYYTVTYEDGVDGEEVFASQVARNLAYGDTTPAFNGTPERDGYYFAGWTPAVAPYVTGDAVYKATWGQKGGITITGASDTVIYNGTEQSVVGYSVTGLPEGYTLEDIAASDYVAKGTDVGTHTGSFSKKASDVIVRDASDNDVTAQYVVTLVPGTLTVNKRTVTLTSESASKAYDGTALTAPNVTVGGDGFVSGEVTDVKATGSVTNVGSVANTITYTEGAAFKADNYSITKTEGTLTVTAHSDDVVVTITEHSGSYQYDGTEKTVTGYDVTSIQIGGADTTLYTEADFEFTGTASVSGTAAGTYNMELKASDFLNKNANFDGKVTFVIVDGTLTITNADPKVTVKYVLKTLSGSTTEVASAPYDGQQANPFTVAYNGSYTIAVGTGSGNYVAPATITVDGKNYNYSSASGALTATGVTEDVTVTLVYEEEFVFIPVIRYGTLEISKQLDAPADFPANTRFTFNIYRISYYNGNKTYYDTVYLKAGETVTLRVEMGNYYVEEADASVDGYKLVVDCTDSDCTVQVNGGAKSSITFLNTYTELILELDDHFGYIIGYPDETVRPTQNITRAEVATIFFRMMTDTARAHYWSTENTFSDVSEDDWFNNAISTLQNAGVLDGYGDGTFRPNAYITRAELVKIAVSFYGTAAGKTSHFADVDAHWAEDFISAAEAIGFVDGYEDDTFKPDRLITRAETMKIVNRALGRKPHKDGLHKYMIEWVDNMDKTKWYYAEVQEATNSHEYEWEDTGFETWTAILPIRNWAALEKSWSEAHD